MEHRALMVTSQTWKGPKGSTFSPGWNAPSHQPTTMMSPCPDVVKSPRQHAVSTAHPRVPSGNPQSHSTDPSTSTSFGWSALANAASQGVDRESNAVGPIRNEETVLPAHSPEFRRRSFSAAGGSNLIAPRRRCDSYVQPCPDNSPHDASRDDDDDDDNGGGTSRLSPNASPEHSGQRSRSRSIILRKTKRRPPPPARSVSLRRDSAAQLRDKRTNSLYIDREAPANDSFLPDLILISTPRSEEDPEHPPAQSARAPIGTPGTSNGQQIRHRSTDLCCHTSNGGQKIHSSSETVRPPPPPRRPPTLISKPPLFQQSSLVSLSRDKYSSQTPPTVVHTTSILGPDPLGCKMRTKSSTPPTSRLRLSLELPVVVPIPEPVKSNVVRRHSESSGSSGTARPKQRLTNSMLVMPVVTQEDLSNVRLRSVSSSDSDKGPDGSPEVIREEEPGEDMEMCLAIHQSPKVKPPVAAKPPAHKWLPMHMVKSSSASSHFTETPPASQTESHGDVCAVERRAKPKRWHQPPRCVSDGVTAQRHQVVEGQAYQVAHPFCHQETRDARRTESLRDKLDTKKKPVPPPVAKKPDVVFVPPVTSLEQESPRGYVWSGNSGVYQTPASNYQDRDFTGQDLNHQRIKDGFFLDDDAEEMMSEVRTLCLSEQEEFDQTSLQPATEDLFTIIHRSKKKLLGRKEAADISGNRQGYGSPIKGTQGIVQKSSSKNDNFMAFLQRRRSNKASSGERLSAAELLKSTKPLAGPP
ncbi:hypothetical protein DPEC_G00236440 [Dallia pectoralis]|uniref:Uncharacterized protein n=1 Tax=Dallia pectoralis TaxID=75939 RepID=A0ACC2FYR3_DALPE|nr:hypothetical protein DPEC_G00236440 [Dallia pectoralis]